MINLTAVRSLQLDSSESGMRMIAVIEVSFVLCHRIDREIEEVGGLALSVDFHVELLSVMQVLPFPLENG